MDGRRETHTLKHTRPGAHSHSVFVHKESGAAIVNINQKEFNRWRGEEFDWQGSVCIAVRVGSLDSTALLCHLYTIVCALFFRNFTLEKVHTLGQAVFAHPCDRI